MKFKSKNSNFWPDLLWNDPYTKIAVDIDKIWIYEHEQIKRVFAYCILSWSNFGWVLTFKEIEDSRLNWDFDSD